MGSLEIPFSLLVLNFMWCNWIQYFLFTLHSQFEPSPRFNRNGIIDGTIWNTVLFWFRVLINRVEKFYDSAKQFEEAKSRSDIMAATRHSRG